MSLRPDPSLVSQLTVSILSELYRLNTAPSPSFWSVYGPLLARDQEVHQQSFLLDMIQDAVRRKDAATVDWAAGMLVEFPSILTSQQNQTRVDSLRGLVTESLSTDNSEEIRRFSEVLGIETDPGD